MQAQGSGVGVGEVLEIVDDALEDERLLVQGGEQGRVGVHDTVSGHLQPAADIGEGAAQLVRDVADHRLALGLQPGPALGEFVEGRREDAGLVAGRHGHPDMPVRRLLGGRGQRAQRPDQPGGDDGGHGHGDGKHQAGGAHDLGPVRRGQVEARGGPVPDAQEQVGGRGDIGVELGPAGLVDAVVRLPLGPVVGVLLQLAHHVPGVHPPVGDVHADEQRLDVVQSAHVQTGAGVFGELGQRLVLGGGGGVETSVGALQRHVVDGAAVLVGEGRAAGRGARHGRLDAVVLVARAPFLGECVQPGALGGGEPVRAHHPGVDAAALGAAVGVGVGAQRVDGGGGARRQRGAGRRGVGDHPAVGGGQGDPAADPAGQLAQAALDALPVGVGRRVPAEPGEHVHVVGEDLPLFLAQGAGGGLHRQPGRRRDRAHGDQHRGDQQPDQEPLAQRYAGPHPRPPLSL